MDHSSHHPHFKTKVRAKYPVAGDVDHQYLDAEFWPHSPATLVMAFGRSRH